MSENFSQDGEGQMQPIIRFQTKKTLSRTAPINFNDSDDQDGSFISTNSNKSGVKPLTRKVKVRRQKNNQITQKFHLAQVTAVIQHQQLNLGFVGTQTNLKDDYEMKNLSPARLYESSRNNVIPSAKFRINLVQEQSQADVNEAKFSLATSVTSRFQLNKDSPIQTSFTQGKSNRLAKGCPEAARDGFGLLKSRTLSKPLLDIIDPDSPSMAEPFIEISSNNCQLYIERLSGGLDLKFKEPSNLVSSTRQNDSHHTKPNAEEHSIKNANSKRIRERTTVCITSENPTDLNVQNIYEMDKNANKFSGDAGQFFKSFSQNDTRESIPQSHQMQNSNNLTASFNSQIVGEYTNDVSESNKKIPSDFEQFGFRIAREHGENDYPFIIENQSDAVSQYSFKKNRQDENTFFGNDAKKFGGMDFNDDFTAPQTCLQSMERYGNPEDIAIREYKSPQRINHYSNSKKKIPAESASKRIFEEEDSQEVLGLRLFEMTNQTGPYQPEYNLKIEPAQQSQQSSNNNYLLNGCHQADEYGNFPTSQRCSDRVFELKKQLNILLDKLEHHSDMTSRRNHQEIRQISSKLNSNMSEDDLKLLELKLSQIFSIRASEMDEQVAHQPTHTYLENRKRSQLSQGSQFTFQNNQEYASLAASKQQSKVSSGNHLSGSSVNNKENIYEQHNDQILISRNHLDQILKEYGGQGQIPIDQVHNLLSQIQHVPEQKAYQSCAKTPQCADQNSLEAFKSLQRHILTIPKPAEIFDPKLHLENYLQESSEKKSEFPASTNQLEILHAQLDAIMHSQHTSEQDQKQQDRYSLQSATSYNLQVNQFGQRNASLHSSVFSEQFKSLQILYESNKIPEKKGKHFGTFNSNDLRDFQTENIDQNRNSLQYESVVSRNLENLNVENLKHLSEFQKDQKNFNKIGPYPELSRLAENKEHQLWRTQKEKIDPQIIAQRSENDCSHSPKGSKLEQLRNQRKQQLKSGQLQSSSSRDQIKNLKSSDTQDNSSLTNMFIAEEDFTLLQPLNSAEALKILSQAGNKLPVVHVPYAMLMKHFEYDDQSQRLLIKQSRFTRAVQQQLRQEARFSTNPTKQKTKEKAPHGVQKFSTFDIESIQEENSNIFSTDYERRQISTMREQEDNDLPCSEQNTASPQKNLEQEQLIDFKLHEHHKNYKQPNASSKSSQVATKLSFDAESDLRQIRHVMDRLETEQNLANNSQEFLKIQSKHEHLLMPQINEGKAQRVNLMMPANFQSHGVMQMRETPFFSKSNTALLQQEKAQLQFKSVSSNVQPRYSVNKDLFSISSMTNQDSKQNAEESCVEQFEFDSRQKENFNRRKSAGAIGIERPKHDHSSSAEQHSSNANDQPFQTLATSVGGMSFIIPFENHSQVRVKDQYKSQGDSRLEYLARNSQHRSKSIKRMTQHRLKNQKIKDARQPSPNPSQLKIKSRSQKTNQNREQNGKFLQEKPFSRLKNTKIDANDLHKKSRNQNSLTEFRHAKVDQLSHVILQPRKQNQSNSRNSSTEEVLLIRKIAKNQVQQNPQRRDCIEKKKADFKSRTSSQSCSSDQKKYPIKQTLRHNTPQGNHSSRKSTKNQQATFVNSRSRNSSQLSRGVKKTVDYSIEEPLLRKVQKYRKELQRDVSCQSDKELDEYCENEQNNCLSKKGNSGGGRHSGFDVNKNPSLYQEFIADRYSNNTLLLKNENRHPERFQSNLNAPCNADSEEELMNQKFEGIRKRVDQSLRQLEQLDVDYLGTRHQKKILPNQTQISKTCSHDYTENLRMIYDEMNALRESLEIELDNTTSTVPRHQVGNYEYDYKPEVIRRKPANIGGQVQVNHSKKQYRKYNQPSLKQIPEFRFREVTPPPKAMQVNKNLRDESEIETRLTNKKSILENTLKCRKSAAKVSNNSTLKKQQELSVARDLTSRHRNNVDQIYRNNDSNMYIEIFEPCESANPVRLAKRPNLGLKENSINHLQSYQTQKAQQTRNLYSNFTKEVEIQPSFNALKLSQSSSELDLRLRALERNNLIKKYSEKIGQVLYDNRRQLQVFEPTTLINQFTSAPAQIQDLGT